MNEPANIDKALLEGTKTVREALAANRYLNLVPYGYEMAPVDEDKMTVRQAREHKEEEGKKRTAQRRKYHEEDARLSNLLRADLEREHKVAGHPKAAKLWEIVWSEGHSGGYSEIINYYEQFVELLK